MTLKRTQTELPELNFAAVLDGMPNAVLVVDRDISIVYANIAAEGIFKSSSAKLSKQGLEKFVHPQSPLILFVKQFFQNPVPLSEYGLDISSPRTGVGRTIDVYASPVIDRNDLAILVLRERGMADRIERQLTHRSAARSVTGLASMLAHEIKNPLSGIRGAAQLLGAVVDEKDKELARLITDETDRIVKLVDEMEVFSNDSPFTPGPVNVHSILGQIRQMAEHGFAKNISFTEYYDPSLPFVAGQRGELTQIFLNLIKNAAQALGDASDAKITLSSGYRSGVRLRPPGAKQRTSLPLEFCISDNGSGIPGDIRAHIFEPFVTSQINGSGLGLALVAKLIQRHGGVVEFEDNHPGTMFRILLPEWKGPYGALEDEEHV
ncbi:MAG: ATP-binding protein [Pseudomonadota bacterium]